MSVFRRRRSEMDAQRPTKGNWSLSAPAAAPESKVSNAPAPKAPLAPPAELRVPPHIERALITLTAKMQQCIERLDAMEHRLDELTETVMNTPSHSDVLEVRLHSAKLAAELARATVELRGEIGLASEEARRAVRASRNDNGDTPVSMPVDVDIEKAQPIDITDDATPRPIKGNWSQSA